MNNYILRRKKLGLTSCKGITANSTTGLIYKRNDGELPNDASYVFRWGCTSDIPGNPTIINKAAAIRFVTDKRGSRSHFAFAGLAPCTWLPEQGWALTLPVMGLSPDVPVDKKYIVRRATHSQGRFLWVITPQDYNILAELDATGTDYYISEYIPKVAEYRVFVCSGRVVWVAKKTPGNPDDIAWNVAQGGRFDNVRFDDWPLAVIRNAIECMSLTELDFGGVDVMVNAEGRAYCLEINSAPSQTSPYRQSCVAKVFDYITLNGNDKIPVVDNGGSYREFIHPAIR